MSKENKRLAIFTIIIFFITNSWYNLTIGYMPGDSIIFIILKIIFQTALYSFFASIVFKNEKF